MLKIIQYLILVTLCIILLESCNRNSDNETEKIVKLIPTKAQKLKLGTVSQLVQLENTENSLLQSIEKTIVDLPNDRIFVLSDLNIYFFTAKGKFITKLKIGRGPGEISRIVSFSVDKKEKFIYATQVIANRICKIDYNGVIVDSYDILNFHCMAIQHLYEDNVFLLNNTASKTNPFFIGRCNLNEKIVGQSFIPSNESNYPLLSYSMVSNFTKVNDRLYFAYSSIFGLYEYKGDQFKKIISYDLGEKEVPNNFHKRFEKGRKMGIFRDESKRIGYVPYLKSSFFFKGYNLVIIDDEEYNCFAISNNFEDVFLNGSINEYFNLPRIKSLKIPVEIDQHYITFSCAPLDFFDSNEIYQSKKIEVGGYVLDVNYDSNPFLIIIE
jgi:hypothetical protein